ncbi:hypothetical protein KC571_03795 [candidate division WWE3 bacterium]|uniref:Uncharacterized protein n=1 Tax=candidate division WWE3 bacterium TaxID=2053526 RepID=A0A955LIK5_UNCKA|nr:hypothetical protein [candidate division WWE3 bacterium]
MSGSKKSISIPDGLWHEFEKIAEREGLEVVEVLRKFFQFGLVADAIVQESAGLGGIFFKENHSADYIPLLMFSGDEPKGPDWLNDLDLFEN